jgi:phage shock protein A
MPKFTKITISDVLDRFVDPNTQLERAYEEIQSALVETRRMLAESLRDQDSRLQAELNGPFLQLETAVHKLEVRKRIWTEWNYAGITKPLARQYLTLATAIWARGKIIRKLQKQQDPDLQAQLASATDTIDRLERELLELEIHAVGLFKVRASWDIERSRRLGAPAVQQLLDRFSTAVQKLENDRTKNLDWHATWGRRVIMARNQGNQQLASQARERERQYDQPIAQLDASLQLYRELISAMGASTTAINSH